MPSNAELVAWSFERLNAKDLPSMRRRSTADTVERFPDGAVVSNFVVFDQMPFARAIGMLAPDGSRADGAVKAAFNACWTLTARLRGS